MHVMGPWPGAPGDLHVAGRDLHMPLQLNESPSATVPVGRPPLMLVSLNCIAQVRGTCGGVLVNLTHS